MVRIEGNIQIQNREQAESPDIKIPLFRIIALAGCDSRPLFRRKIEMVPDKNRKQDSECKNAGYGLPLHLIQAALRLGQFLIYCMISRTKAHSHFTGHGLKSSSCKQCS